MRKKICLVLGSGGAKGLAHIGVIKALSEAGLEINQIAGASVGSLVGGLYAAKPDYAELEKILKKIGYLEIFKILVDFPIRNALLKGDKMEKFLNEVCGKAQIENLPIKFRAVCSDIVSGEKYVFAKGSLVKALRASAAVPALFSPVRHEGRLLVDGGTLDPVPVGEVKAGKNDIVVAVGLYGKFFPKSYRKMSEANITGIAFAATQLMLCQLSKIEMEKADIKILPPVEDMNVLDFVRAKKYVELGYKSTMEKMPEILKLVGK